MEGYKESLPNDHSLEIHTVDRIKEIQSNMHMFQITRITMQATFVAFEYVKEEGKIFCCILRLFWLGQFGFYH